MSHWKELKAFGAYNYVQTQQPGIAELPKTISPVYFSSTKNVDVDIDSTLVMWDISKYPDCRRITVNVVDPSNPLYDTSLAVNQKNVNLAIKLAKIGYALHFQSRSEHLWVAAILEKLDLIKYATSIRTKPLYYIDDKSADGWMERLWRNPNE